MPDEAAERITPDELAMEERWLRHWEETGIHRFDPTSTKPVFSIDTPPPTVSGRMHIGHAYSYNQMDFVARYKRMRGFHLFYPFGFDDNGLPTERLTEREVGIKIKDVGRQEFIRQCLEVTKRYEALMEKSWRRIGTSCDWALVYRTIDERARRASQRSFVELYKEGRAYRAERPSIWCPECATAIAQVEAQDKERESLFNDIRFDLAGGGDVTISTTRPELIPACVAVFVHPQDPRTAALQGRRARVPIFGHEVPILASDKVDLEKGTGIVMCCTFGDLTDIDWWAENRLPLRVAIDEHGRMTGVAGPYEGKRAADEARTAVLEDLRGEGRVLAQKKIQQTVNVHERCGTPVEFLVTKQWFVKYLGLKETFLARGAAVAWHPEHMRVRYDNWVKGLKWDWCISRQRYFGVPFPVWYCKKCGAEVVAEVADLPVDPVADHPKRPCPKCRSTDLAGEADVMDTWATSSLTPQIALGWAEKGGGAFARIFPMSLRPQAHEIISFWAFNTIVKAHFHHGSVPWKDIMISGFVKLGKGKKMSKSKGEVVEPAEVVSTFGADALRYWSAGTSLGEDIIWDPKDLTRARRLVTKLRNVNKLVATALGAGFRPPASPPQDLHDADRWILTEYSRLVASATELWEGYDFVKGVKEAENFLWHTLADHYLELVKHRLFPRADPAVAYTLHTVGLGTVKLLAPVLAFVTEDIYQAHYAGTDGAKSVHVASWPAPVLDDAPGHEAGDVVRSIVAAVRNWKREKGIPLNQPMPGIEVVAGRHRDAILRNVADIQGPLKCAAVKAVGEEEVAHAPVSAKPVASILGPKHKKDMGGIVKAFEGLAPAAVATALDTGKLVLDIGGGRKVTLEKGEFEVRTRPRLHGRDVDEVQAGPVTVFVLT